MANRGEEKVRVHMNVVPCSTGNTNSGIVDSHQGQKIFSLPRVVPCFPLLGLMPSGLFMGLSSTIIYTSELILWFHYLCSQCYAAQHSYVPKTKRYI